MTALPLMIGVLCVLAIAYRFYSAFLAAKIAALDDRRVTPAYELNDGHNYHPTNKWVLFGHHFAAISGAGPLIGPVLAAQFGYMPGLLWLLIGVCLAGAVQDFLVLAASLRHKGRSLAEIAREQVGPVSGGASIAAILFIVVVALAGLGIAVVKALGGEEVVLPPKTSLILPAEKNASPGRSATRVQLPGDTMLKVPVKDSVSNAQQLFPLTLPQDIELGTKELADKLLNTKSGATFTLEYPPGQKSIAKLMIPGSSWGVFTIGASIPIALLMGLWMYVLRKKARTRILEASIIGVVLLLSAVQVGSYIPQTSLGQTLDLSKHGIITAMAIYGFLASILPVWLLLCPRDYLSSYLKIGTIAALIVGVLLVNPRLEAPWYTNVWEGKGPNFPGQVFPFLFITIMCGAISGFHALVSSGTTPKMINKEGDARLIGYGAMLMEGLVGIVALIAAASLAPGDYYAIQIPMTDQASGIYAEKLKLIDGAHDDLRTTEINVKENLRGRTGGAVTLAVGMSKIFGGWDFFSHLVGYWYHFAIMFEALFILTTIDTGTRIGRFLVQEVMGKIKPELGRVNWWPGAIFSTALIVAAWGGLLWNNDVATIWPMFGIANQLLAVIALCVVTTIMINSGKRRYVACTLLPLAFIVSTTMTAGYQMTRKFLTGGSNLNAALTLAMLLCVVIILIDSIRVWLKGGNPKMKTPEPAEPRTQVAATL